MTTITPDTSWLAYRALHRYFRRYYRQPPIGPRLPATLSVIPIGTRAINAAAQTATLLTQLWQEEPLDVPEERYAYYFLWAQTLRCSRRDGAPVEIEIGTWRNIGWFPLHVLVGRTPTPTGPAARAWHGWLHTYRWVDAPVHQHFPWIEPSGTANATAARQAWQQLTALATEHAMSVEDVMAAFHPDGTLRRERETLVTDWHPWILLARAECWRREWAPLWALELLLDDRPALVRWWETVRDEMADEPLGWLDNAIRLLKKKQWLTRWRYFRRTVAPSRGVAPRRRSRK